MKFDQRPPDRADYSAADCISYALDHSPPIRKEWTDKARGMHRYVFGHGASAQTFPTYGPARRARMAFALEVAIRICEGGIVPLVKFGRNFMPKVMRDMAVARYRAAIGQPRKTWKWSPEARARLSEIRKAAPKMETAKPRQRGYPLWEISPGLPVPATGHRFTVTRATLEALRSMILPDGL